MCVYLCYLSFLHYQCQVKSADMFVFGSWLLTQWCGGDGQMVGEVGMEREPRWDGEGDGMVREVGW